MNVCRAARHAFAQVTYSTTGTLLASLILPKMAARRAELEKRRQIAAATAAKWKGTT